ncbi:arrestin N-terminal domain-containing protein [Elsinoe australis]|uniref:Arrestin N-terminal domain-containing protein n=1 Tax=Elsinoe australis TaxID=40998 RepID=A0A4U7AP31_9PEZI|nr:arrestin N-terminal domain-containing protein [Elsinoe australis]
MSAHIVLDQDYATFTNLDIVSGKVYVRTAKSISVSTITIKLEGESSTRLLPPPTPQNERPKPAIEFHKILYKTVTLFPPPELRSRPGEKSSFTLPPGTHEYAFSFKIPFNAACALDKNAAPAISVSGMSVEIARPPPGHLRRPLPPTLRGFPGEAEIRYFLKATVARPNILKENIRAYVPFNFSPIEPPREPSTGAEAYARQKHQFIQGSAAPSDQKPDLKGKRSIFSLKSVSLSDEKPPSPDSDPAPHVSVEIRLPEPKILIANGDIPLKILCTALNDQTEHVFLQSLQVEIAHYTHVRAHQVHRNNQGSTVLLSKSNLTIPLEFNDKREALVPPELWYGVPVPSVLPPTFEICNLSRNYELIVRIGLRYEAEKRNPQYTHIDLRLPFTLYSGISPPPEVLSAFKRKPVPSPQSPNLRPETTDQKPPPLPARRPSKDPSSSSSSPTVHSTPFAPPQQSPLNPGAIQNGFVAQGHGSSGPGTPVGMNVPGAWPGVLSAPPPGSSGGGGGPPRYSFVGPGVTPPGSSSAGGMGQALGQAQGQSLWQGYNAQTATGMETHGADGEVYSDAPPSYEDAVADVLPPVQVGGQDRGGYRPPETGGREDRLLPRDEKG